MKVGIRADGSTEMGYGHLTRSDTIASELLNQDESVIYLSETPEVVSSVCDDRSEVLPLEHGTPDEVASKLREIDADAAFIDLSEVPVELQRTVRDICPLAVFLGSARNHIFCDMLVNSHIFAEEEAYEWSGKEPIWCLGPEYLPLRRPFPELAAREKDCSERPARGLILMGGTDPHNITPRVMEAFDPLDIPVTVIVGPGNENHSAIFQRKSLLNNDFSIKKDPDDLAEQMFKADIAVSGFGTTIYELMATRTPFVGIPRTSFERGTADRVADLVDVTYVTKSFDEPRLTTALEELRNDSQRRVRLQNQFECLIDGKGAKRLTRKLRSLVD